MQEPLGERPDLGVRRAVSGTDNTLTMADRQAVRRHDGPEVRNVLGERSFDIFCQG